MKIVTLTVVFLLVTSCTLTMKPCPADTMEDFYFLVDSSGSIDISDYHYNFQFIQKIVDGYYIADDGAKVALLTFGSSVKPKFKLSGDPAFINAKLQNVSFQGSTTNTHKALAYILDNGWNTPANGARNGSHVVILITDGKSTVPAETLEQAERIKKAGFTIIVVGVGNGVDQNEIQAVASKPEYAITVSDYSVLDTIASATSEIACNQEPPPPTTGPTTSTSSPTTSTSIPVRPPPVRLCPFPSVYLQFWVDSSDVVDVNDYKYNFQFIQTIIDAFNISSDCVKVGLNTFGYDVVEVFSENENPAAIRESLQNVAYLGGNTNTHLAVNYAYANSIFFGGYDKQIIIFITGGKSSLTTWTLYESERLKRLNRTAIIVVGVSSFVDLNEIRAIASKPEYAITVNNYAELNSVANKTVEIVRNEVQTPPAPQENSTSD